MRSQGVKRDTAHEVAPHQEALRGDALACLRSAIDSVEPEGLVARYLARSDRPLGDYRRVVPVAVGKAAAAMARGARSSSFPRWAPGVAIVPRGQEECLPEGFETYGGGHPIPNAQGIAGAGAILDLAHDLDEGDLLLCLISGGGSALMTLPPPGVRLADIQTVTDALLRSGVGIDELNCVRKHLDLLKGGRLARAAAPGKTLALVLSDVVGDPLETIASGPVSPDPTTFGEAIEVLRRAGVWAEVPVSVRAHLRAGLEGRAEESPDASDPCFGGVHAEVIGSNRLAVAAARDEAMARGYDAAILTTTLTGEAREVGKMLASIAREIRSHGRPVEPPACLLVAGETTVTVRGTGRGGRNQELALGAARDLAGVPGVQIATLGTDGIDGPTDAAGALVDGRTLERARGLGLDARQALQQNNAYPFFEALDDLIITGPTGTNVMDIALILVA